MRKVRLTLLSSNSELTVGIDYKEETDRSHPRHGRSAALDMSPHLEEELRRLSPDILEYVMRLERMVGLRKQGSDDDEYGMARMALIASDISCPGPSIHRIVIGHAYACSADIMQLPLVIPMLKTLHQM